MVHPDDLYMDMAMREAARAGEAGEVPVGAVLVHPERGIVGKAHNQVETLKDATAHAEILAITQAASALDDWRLEECTLYVTKEPCPMCAGAIVFSRVRRVVWGLTDTKRGGESRFGILTSPETYHRPEILSGWKEDACKAQFLSFFRAVRNHEVGKPGAGAPRG
jgi:tRNA(adenine34) deaminase